jgi:uncharacterized membrane protein YccF (DUF307 family)
LPPASQTFSGWSSPAWWLALAHVVASTAQCLTIIGIPFGVANFKLVPAAFWPLGRQIAEFDQASVPVAA